MADLKILIGGRNFNISCNLGEEMAARESAKLLNDEAELLLSQLGRLPEDKMLLLSGLLLGDKIKALMEVQGALEETLRATQTKLNELSSKFDIGGGGSNISLPELVDNKTTGSSEEKTLLEFQAISLILDNLIKKFNIPYSKKDLKSEGFLSSDDAQESFL